MNNKPESSRFALDEKLATLWLARSMTAYDGLAGEPFPGREAGHVAGHCGHAVARSEWKAGYRECERCPAAAFWAGIAMAEISNGYLCREDHESGGDTAQLTEQAQLAGVITDALAPAGEGKPPAALLYFSFEASGGVSSGYRWMVDVPGHPSFMLSTSFSEFWSLGDGEAEAGLDSAMSVLLEAVTMGNALYAAATTWAASR